MTVLTLDSPAILRDFLSDLREGKFANATPTRVRVAINMMLNEIGKLHKLQEENQLLQEYVVDLRQRIIEEQRQRNILETMIVSASLRNHQENQQSNLVH